MSRFLKCIGALAVVIGASMSAAHADPVIVYSNTTNFSGQGFAAGGATNVGGNTITRMLADDITPLAGMSGRAVESMTFSVANFNAAAVSARARISIYSSDGGSGAPDNLLFSFTSLTLNLSGSAVQLFTLTSASPMFDLTAGPIWAGISFDDNGGTTGATASQLNNLGQGIFGPPSVGSSSDVFFQATSASSFGTADPSGVFQSFGGNPQANFGWAFSVAEDAEVPEPSSLMSMLACVLAWGIVAGLRRRNTG